MIRTLAVAALVAGVSLTHGCGLFGAPEMLVCARAKEDGGCIERRQELNVGKTYTLVVRGRRVPEHAELELARFERGRAVVVSTVHVERSARGHITNPVTLPRVGTYRLLLREDGETRVRTNVRAPRPSVWNVRRTTPAETPAP